MEKLKRKINKHLPSSLRRPWSPPGSPPYVDSDVVTQLLLAAPASALGPGREGSGVGWGLWHWALSKGCVASSEFRRPEREVRSRSGRPLGRVCRAWRTFPGFRSCLCGGKCCSCLLRWRGRQERLRGREAREDPGHGGLASRRGQAWGGRRLHPGSKKGGVGNAATPSLGPVPRFGGDMKPWDTPAQVRAGAQEGGGLARALGQEAGEEARVLGWPRPGRTASRLPSSPSPSPFPTPGRRRPPGNVQGGGGGPLLKSRSVTPELTCFCSLPTR